MNTSKPRIAVLGFHLEGNGFAPPSRREDFLDLCWEEGDAISECARRVSHLPSEARGFYAQMDASGEWEPVPLILIAAPPGGPAEDTVWAEFMVSVQVGLRAALPVDAVYICNHGASSSVSEPDTEGALLTMIREMVGPDIPVVVSYDLHCNISQCAIDAMSGFIAYRTNPHVDQLARGAEAAQMIREILAGMRPVMASIRLPLTPPSLTLLTKQGPYADLMAMANGMIDAPGDGPLANVSVTGGFVFTDVPRCGMTVIATSRGDLAAAQRAVLTIARKAWAERARYIPVMQEVAAAVTIAREAQAPVLLADVADNPGGGGQGNTTWLLRALHEARIPGAALGVFIDAQLADDAHQAGEGAQFDAVFNDLETTFAKRFEARVTVKKLTDGHATGRRGSFAGRQFALGPTALLVLEGSGMQVVVGSLRRQLNEPVMLEMHGIDIASLRCLVVKSRGHYRAGFDEFFADEQIFDIDSPGLTTPSLHRVPFRRLPRPVWPLDAEAQWLEPQWAQDL